MKNQEKGARKINERYLKPATNIPWYWKMLGHNSRYSARRSQWLVSLGLRIDDLRNEMHKEFALIHLTLEQHGQRIAQLEHANLELLKEIRENTISRSEFEELRAKVRQLESKLSE